MLDLANRSTEDLRSLLCHSLGHVDLGIRRTNIQEGVASGITPQIGASNFPVENIQEGTKELESNVEVKLPGFLRLNRYPRGTSLSLIFDLVDQDYVILLFHVVLI